MIVRLGRLVLVAVVAVGSAGRAEEPRSQSAAASAFHVGVCTHFGQNKGLPPANLALMKAAGINSLRDELSWGGVERQRGEYAVEEDRAAIFREARRLGIAPMLIFDYANRLYDDGDRPRSPEALEGYTRYAEFLVRHFGSDVPLYEVWNEYDISIGMPEKYRQGGSPEDYVRMLKHVYPRIKQIEPRITVVGGACTAEGVRKGWLEAIVGQGALEACDVLSLHTYLYGARDAQRTPEAWCVWMQEVEAMLRKQHGDREVPLMVTEMGWPTHAGKPNSTSPSLSASYLGRLYLLARTLPFLRGIWWYDFQDDGWEAEYNEHNFGIVRPDLTPKPSYYVISAVSALAARGEYLGRLESPHETVWILRFRLDGEQVWAAWSADDLPHRLTIETPEPGKPLVIEQLGHPAVARGWGHRDWAVGRSEPQANRASLVVDDRPWLLRGGLESAKIVAVK